MMLFSKNIKLYIPVKILANSNKKDRGRPRGKLGGPRRVRGGPQGYLGGPQVGGEAEKDS